MLAWVAVVGAVGAWVTTSATSALTLACLWVAVTLIVPALANQVVSAVVPVVRAKLAMLLDGEWSNRKYDVAAFNALVAIVPPAAHYGGTINITSWIVLLTWLRAAIAVTVAGLRRPFLSPSPFVRFSLAARLSQTTTVS